MPASRSGASALRAWRSRIEEGVITRVSVGWVFVRYGSDVAARATDPADLELLAGKVTGDD